MSVLAFMTSALGQRHTDKSAPCPLYPRICTYIGNQQGWREARTRREAQPA